MLVATIENNQQKDWTVTVTINSQLMKFKINTGAQCNVISSKTYHSLSLEPLSKSKARLIAFGGHRLNSLGKASLLCEYKGKLWPIEFEVLDNVSNILGLTASTEMKLVQKVELLASDMLCKYADTFSGLGCITDVEYHIQLDPTCQPVVHPPRRVPVKMRPKLKDELQ